jgi:3-oxoacyl-[acyl-carrier-protein] synthase II
VSVPVAITGLGVVSALGVGVDAFRAGLWAGRSGCRPVQRIEAPPGAHAAEAPMLEPRRFAHTPQGRRIDRTSLLALASARLALDDAGLAAAVIAGARTGIGLGSAFGNIEETGHFLDRLLEKGTGNPLVFPNLVMNAPLSYATIEFGVTGPSAMLTEQEASGEAAIAWGAQLVADGAVDVCLAGAADELTTSLHQLRRETRTIAPGLPRPFDVDADGPCPGEGSAVLVLEALDHARARGARVYAVVVPHPGFGVPSPVHGWTRDAQAIAVGLRHVVAGAGLVVASASGQPSLDAVEAAALADVLPAGAVVTAPRGAIGDFGAAGALAVVVGALAVASGEVPPTLGCRVPRAGLPVVTGVPRVLATRVAMIDGLARGGICRPLRLEAE